MSLPILAIYSGAGLDVGVARSLPILSALGPLGLSVAMPHGDSAEWARAAARIRTVLPSVRLWFGCGVDALATDLASGRVTEVQVIEEFVRRATVAQGLGAEMIVWDAERAWKVEQAGRDLSGVAESALHAVMARVPIAQGFTSYGHPSGHTSFPWRAFLGANSPVRVMLWQNYAVQPDPRQRATAAQVIEQARSDDASVQVMVASGQVASKFAVGGAGFGRYVLGYRCDPVGTVAVAESAPVTAWWAAPELPEGRMDAEGYAALQAVLRRGASASGLSTQTQGGNGRPAAVIGGVVAGGLLTAAVIRALGSGSSR